MKPRFLLEMAASFASRERNDSGRYRLAALGLRPDGLQVVACNKGVSRQRTPAGHAEYRVHSKLIARSVVAVARVRRDGTWAIAKPCAQCETLLRNRRVSVVYYTIAPGEYGVLRF